jgi:hypothetical protein
MSVTVTQELTQQTVTVTGNPVENNVTVTVSNARGLAGEAGAAGAAGPNTLTTATTTNLDGFIFGNGANISGATASATAATANTLVLRDGSGGASFAGVTLSGINTNSGSYSQVGGANFNVATTTAANLTATGSGTVTVSGEGGTTISGGTLTFSPSGFAYGAGAASAHRTALGLGTADDVGFRTVNVSGTAPSNTPAAGIGLTSAAHFALFANSTVRMVVISTGATIGSGSDYAWSSLATPTNATRDLILARDAANTLAQRNGTAQQESRIYGTYTGPGNYRRLALKMDAAGVAQIVAEGGGSGAAGNRLEFVTGGATRMTVAADGNITASGSIQTGGYTFATLPTPTTGMRAYITDGAALPLYMANAAGGGSTVTPVFYNGTNWINA